MAAQNVVGIYDFGGVIMLIKHKMYGQNININGWMPDTGITIDRNSEAWTMANSGDGKATTMVYNPDTSGVITFSLNQSTDSLDKMNAICDFSKRNKSVNILFEITLVDTSSRTIYYCPQAVAGYPQSLEFNKDESGREFKIYCGDLQEKLGGSSLIPAETRDILAAFGITVDATWNASY